MGARSIEGIGWSRMGAKPASKMVGPGISGHTTGQPKIEFVLGL